MKMMNRFSPLIFFSFEQLLIYDMHIGHTIDNYVFYTCWLIFCHFTQLFIINLYKTLLGLRAGFLLISSICQMGGPIWFINLDKSTNIIVKSHAQLCGEFFLTSLWINGLISNYHTIYMTFMKMRQIIFSAYPTKNKNALDLYKNWYFTRTTWPRMIFVSSVFNSYQPTKEALSLGIPCLGVVDTNTYTHTVTVPLPGNDDSIPCLAFLNDMVSYSILLRKYFNVISWYLNIRKGNRMITFWDWLIEKKENKKKKKKSYISLVKFNFNFLKYFDLGMNSFFLQNTKYILGYNDYSQFISKEYKSSLIKLYEVILTSKSFNKVFGIGWARKLFAGNVNLVYPFAKRYMNKNRWISKIDLNKFIEQKSFLNRFYKSYLQWRDIDLHFYKRFLKYLFSYKYSYFNFFFKSFFKEKQFIALNNIYVTLIFKHLKPESFIFPITIYKKRKKFLVKKPKINKEFFLLYVRNIKKKYQFSEICSLFNKKLSIKFDKLIKKKGPHFLSFIRSCLSKYKYYKYRNLIKSFFFLTQKRKFKYISNIFNCNLLRYLKIKKKFFNNIKKNFNKKQKLKLNNFLKNKIYRNVLIKKKTRYKYNIFLPKYYFEYSDYIKIFNKFILFWQFIILKGTAKYEKEKKSLSNLKLFFQICYWKCKIKYLNKNWYLKKLVTNEVMAQYILKQKKKNLSKIQIWEYKFFRYYEMQTIKKLQKIWEEKKFNIHWTKFWEYKFFTNFKLYTIRKELNKKQYKERKKFIFLKNKKKQIKEILFSENPNYLELINLDHKYKFKKKSNLKKNNLNYKLFFYRLNFTRKKNWNKKKFFRLCKKISFNRILNNYKLLLGWLILDNKCKINFYWKFQNELFLFPKWYILFSSLSKKYIYNFENIKKFFFNYKMHLNRKIDTSINKFFVLFHYAPNFLKISNFKIFFKKFLIQYKSANNWWIIKDLYVNNISLNVKDFIKFYGYIWTL